MPRRRRGKFCVPQCSMMERIPLCPLLPPSDRMRIVLRGRGTHAAQPWRGIDPIPVAARIVLAIEALPAREVELGLPSVVSIGSIQGGSRNNVLPDEVEYEIDTNSPMCTQPEELVAWRAVLGGANE